MSGISETLQWSLDSTVGEAMTFGTGLMRAATSDNVQPIALLACQEYGVKLAMSQEVRLKMEQVAKLKHTSHVLNFFKAKIGCVLEVH